MSPSAEHVQAEAEDKAMQASWAVLNITHRALSERCCQVLSAGQVRTWGELFVRPLTQAREFSLASSGAGFKVCPWRFGPPSDFRDLQDPDVQFLRAWPLQESILFRLVMV